jgi:hypothetical protein
MVAGQDPRPRLKRLVAYRATPAALDALREAGLVPGIVHALAGAASGPRWIPLAALDRSLLAEGLVDGPTGNGRRRLLVGASAGAWRMLALASRNPVAAHDALLDGYIGQVFPRGTRPDEVSDAYRRMLTTILGDGGHALDHPTVDVAVHVARPRRFVPWRGKPTQVLSMAVAAATHAVSRGGVDTMFRRVLVHSRPDAFPATFDGDVVPLTPDNLLDAALASGTVPVYMAPVRGVAGPPRHRFVDGGLTDYHLRQDYVGDSGGLTLFPHFQRDISALWFDRVRSAHRPETIGPVLQIWPTEEFLARLPDGRLPHRDDFFRYADAPDERIRRWREAADLGNALAEQFLDDLRSGRLPELVTPMV